MTAACADKTAYDDRSTPAPLVLSSLRDHFRLTYLLNETQVETMMMSSSKSLEQAFTSIDEILQKEAPEMRLAACFHGLRGLLLNMGATEWAAYTRTFEEKLTTGEDFNYVKIIEILERGLGEILLYRGEMAVGGGISETTNPVRAK